MRCIFCRFVEFFKETPCGRKLLSVIALNIAGSSVKMRTRFLESYNTTFYVDAATLPKHCWERAQNCDTSFRPTFYGVCETPEFR